MLVDQIKSQIIQAMKDKNTAVKDILRVAKGELDTIQARQTKPLNDEEAGKVLRKLIKSNEETLALTKDASMQAKLENENKILSVLLPQTLDVQQIVAALDGLVEQIQAAGNDGQATGIAMKHLKSSGTSVTGGDVAQAVKKLRAGS